MGKTKQFEMKLEVPKPVKVIEIETEAMLD